MEGLVSSAALGFNLKTRGMFRDKFGYVCAADKGSGFVRIQRQSGTDLPDSIVFQHKIKEFLCKNGVLVDNFLISTQGTPYFALGGDYFVATKAFGQSFPVGDFANNEFFLTFIGNLAKMHSLLALLDVEGSSKFCKEKSVAKAAESLVVLRKKLLKAGKFSEFDMLFLKGCERFMGHIENYANIPDDVLNNRRYICHNILKEENIYNDGGKIIITNFSEAGHGHYLFDLAYALKRRLKVKPGTGILPDVLFDTYLENFSHEKTLNQEIFRHILLYPDKFIKISLDYYSKKRSFAPKTYLFRMEECFLANEAIMEYIGKT